MTKREIDESYRRGDRYELQFWGEINLGIAMKEEYAALVLHGYPKRFPHLSRWLDSGDLVTTPVVWEIAERP